MPKKKNDSIEVDAYIDGDAQTFIEEMENNETESVEKSGEVVTKVGNERPSAIADMVRAVGHTPRPKRETVAVDDGYGSNAKYIRDMRLTDEQKNLIIEQELRKILAPENAENLQGGVIKCFLEYPNDSVGFSKVLDYVKADFRLVQRAWDYYKDNAVNPTVKDFANILGKILGRGEKLPKAVILHLN